MLSKVVSSTIFKVFGMTRPGIEPRSPGPLANTLTAGHISRGMEMNRMVSKYKNMKKQSIQMMRLFIVEYSATIKHCIFLNSWMYFMAYPHL